MHERNAMRGLAAVWIGWAALAASASAAERPPVLTDTPACEHRKLGVVSIEAGVRATEASLDKKPPAVHYGRAFERLADAAAAQGANAVVLEGCRVGKGAVVAAGAVVVSDVAPNTVVAGVPARVLKDKDGKTAEKTALIDALRAL